MAIGKPTTAAGDEILRSLDFLERWSDLHQKVATNASNAGAVFAAAVYHYCYLDEPAEAERKVLLDAYAVFMGQHSGGFTSP